MTVRLSRQADADIRRLIRWLAERSPDAADKAIDQIFRSIDLLDRHPEIAPSIAPRSRQKVVHFGRDGFLIHYSIETDRVTVQRVLHGRQDR